MDLRNLFRLGKRTVDETETVSTGKGADGAGSEKDGTAETSLGKDGSSPDPGAVLPVDAVKEPAAPAKKADRGVALGMVALLTEGDKVQGYLTVKGASILFVSRGLERAWDLVPPVNHTDVYFVYRSRWDAEPGLDLWYVSIMAAGDHEPHDSLPRFLMGERQAQRLDKLISEWCNSKRAPKFEEFRNKCSEQVLAFWHNDEALGLIGAFVRRMDKSILISPEELLATENLLKKGMDWPGLLWSLSYVEHLVDSGLTTWDDASKVATPKSARFVDDLRLLSKLLAEKGFFSQDDPAVRIMAVWEIVRRHAMWTIGDDFLNVLSSLQSPNESANIHESTEDLLDLYLSLGVSEAKSSSSKMQLSCALLRTGQAEHVVEDWLHVDFSSNDPISVYLCIEPMIEELVEKRRLSEFEKSLFEDKRESVSLDEIDLMSGAEFEEFVASLLARMGYAVETTQHTHDQGIDIVARKKGTSIGVQAKCYSSPVSNAAVQQVVAGLAHYGLDKGMVVTNSRFTASAVELAEANDIVLWNRETLKEKIESC